ncbi:hypothetical protein WH47_12211 [Habropoda laboriosa]|uniref:Uncharacterized protein n=1 Tax=Habropoda laboriosa TaxID=597456 RepID=A0A0L7RAW7_9HYME|nr:hypothetical protein WH47_12211 [Habropoda laboriosa]
MHLNTCFALLLMGLAFALALPAEKVEKSLEEKNVVLEDTVDDKARSKKAALWMQQPQIQAVNYVPQAQTVSMLPQAATPAVQSFSIESAPATVQSFNLPAAAPAVQSFSIESAPAPLQTVSVQRATPVVQSYSIESAPAQFQTVNVQRATPVVQSYSIESAPAQFQTVNVQRATPVVQSYSIESAPATVAESYSIQNVAQAVQPLGLSQPLTQYTTLAQSPVFSSLSSMSQPIVSQTSTTYV